MKNAFLNTTNHNVAWLHKRYLADELTLKAPFQRNPVWTEKQSSYLIDTILNGFPIPELYMQEHSDETGSDKYVVVDGQQRVRACMDYISGKFGLDGTDSPRWADIKFDELDGDEKKRIFNYTFVVRLLPEMEEVELRKIFQRLNRNVVALNAQELRHATYWGEFIKSAEYIADDDSWSDAGLFTANDVRRMQDIEYISELMIGFLHGVQNKKNSLDKWYSSYEQEFARRRELERKFLNTLREILALKPSVFAGRWRKKSDFYSLFLVLVEYSQYMPFPRETRERLASNLVEFGRKVDAFLHDPDQAAATSVKKYSTAVERAASDLSNRKERRNELDHLVAGVLSSQLVYELQEVEVPI